MDRRRFLVGGAAVGAALTTVEGCTRPRGAAAPTAEQLGDWAAVRAEFPLARDRVHMSGFFLVSHPRSVGAAIEAHRRGFDDNPFEYLEHNIYRVETEVREKAAAYLGGSADDVALTTSTTMGLGVVYGGLELRPQDEILTTTHDHIVSHMALEWRAKRTGNTVRKVALYDRAQDASIDEIATRLEKAITSRTRIVAVTWVHSGTGVKLPIATMAEVVARANARRDERDRALLFVDGVHGFGNQAASVAELGCDCFIAGCHKWLFGPRGTGLVWARREGWAVTSPIIPSFEPGWRPEPLERLPQSAWMTPGGFQAYEHRWALGAAFDFQAALGRARVAARTTELAARCKRQLAQLRGVRVATPMADELSAGIICFEIDGVDAKTAVGKLAADKIVASFTPVFYDPPYARLSPSLLTLEDDVDRAVAAVAAISG